MIVSPRAFRGSYWSLPFAFGWTHALAGVAPRYWAQPSSFTPGAPSLSGEASPVACAGAASSPPASGGAVAASARGTEPSAMVTAGEPLDVPHPATTPRRTAVRGRLHID